MLLSRLSRSQPSGVVIVPLPDKRVVTTATMMSPEMASGRAIVSEVAFEARAVVPPRSTIEPSEPGGGVNSACSKSGMLFAGGANAPASAAAPSRAVQAAIAIPRGRLPNIASASAVAGPMHKVLPPFVYLHRLTGSTKGTVSLIRVPPEEASYPRHNWLPGVIPADARRFRVFDGKLGETLAAGGAELVQFEPEVELGTTDTLADDAPYVVIAINHLPPEGGSRWMRAGRRATRSLQVRVRAERARRNLRARSYPMTSVVLWEWEQAVRLPHLRSSSKSQWRERFPLEALVIGSRRGRCPTVLDASLTQAGDQIGARLDCGWPLATQASLVAIAEEGVLRVAIGPAGQHLGHQRDALMALKASSPPPEIAHLIPDWLADGTTGLAQWSLEQRMPGSPAPFELPPRLFEECIDFLVALSSLGDNSAPTTSPARDAEVIARNRDGERAQALRRLGRDVETTLAGAPRVFAHGDFWSRNLLIENGRLTGVVDWDHGGPGKLPFLDLLQLRLNMVRAGTHQFFGPALVEYLLPWAWDGGDDDSRAYAKRLGIEVNADQLEAFVIAYWLDRIGHELGSYADRIERPVWMQQNVDFVLEAIADAGILDRSGASAAS